MGVCSTQMLVKIYDRCHQKNMKTSNPAIAEQVSTIFISIFWKLFRARATPMYNIVAFEASHDLQRDDPLKKAFEYARTARRYASKIQV